MTKQKDRTGVAGASPGDGKGRSTMERRSDRIIRELRQLADNRILVDKGKVLTVSSDFADYLQDLFREAAKMIEDLRGDGKEG